jgi:pseudouridine kinase
MLAHASLLILDANLVDDAIAWLTGTFADKVIFADTVSTTKAPRLRPYLASIHTLKTSTIEVEALTGCQARTQAQLREVAGDLHAEGVERVFITRGAAGVFYSANDTHGNEKLKGPKREVLNAGGAGDAFLAGLAYAWLTDLPLDKTLSFALAAADITVSHPATINPALTLAAVNRAMEAQHAC